VDSKLNMNQQHLIVAKADNSILSCRRRALPIVRKKVILPLYSVLLWPRLKCWIQFWAPQYKRGMDILERV